MNKFALEANECIGITKSKTKLKILGHPDEIDVPGGEIIKILRLANFGVIFIKLYSIDKRNLILSELTYSCDQNTIKILNEYLGSMLMTIGDREKRLLICNNSDYERFLVNLKLNDVVKVNKFLFKRDRHLICVVKYIGAVPEIGPGTFVGCTLYDETETIDERNKIAAKYINCNEMNGFIRNCGCFFTRTMLLDQNIDNLLKIINRTNDKNTNKLKFFDTAHAANNTKETNMFNKTPSISTVTQPKVQIESTGATTSSSSQKPIMKPVFRSTHVYPEERPTQIKFVPADQFFSTPTSSTKQSIPYGGAEKRTSLNWTPPQHKVTLQPNTPEPPPKKNRCIVM